MWFETTNDIKYEFSFEWCHVATKSQQSLKHELNNRIASNLLFLGIKCKTCTHKIETQMESDQNDDEQRFFDALDEFPSQNYTDICDHLSQPSTSQSTLRHRKKPTFEGSTSQASTLTEIPVSETRFTDRRHTSQQKLKQKKEACSEISVDSPQVDSVEQNELSDSADGSDVADLFSSNLLVFIVELIIKAVSFQVNLFVYFITAPIYVLHCFYVLIIDPFGAVRKLRGVLLRKIVTLWNCVGGKIGALLSEWFKDYESIGKVSLQFGWGIFWAIYVCVVLWGLLVFSVMVGGFVMRILVEEPMQMREVLNFDYTKNSPVAYVPIVSCNGVACDGNCEGFVGDVKSSVRRGIPANHRLQVTVVLTLPESEYNRNLGMFQVRVDFLSAKGKTLASKSHPCMLKFKSEAIRALLTFLNVLPLLTGYASESQTLEFKIKGFREGVVPTSCLKVTIEQRAEFRAGAGIPEIYDASLVLESELPFFKRIIWNWRRTLFIWISIYSFVMQLIVTLICCRSIILPRTRPRNNSTVENVVRNNPHSILDVRAAPDIADQPKYTSSDS